ncbi:Two-component response regulator-like [Actinidia chinensis var. chinensis]|uniref:Two-component response regulator-like n=1 Tax=Actinidia chinensis var. chinensis TaxID=1590841 RepID=A0A2R6PL50_ACTCC|nr:Two-component response regulator-like [Actinidia chinensis var. chinensis]
MRGIWVNTKGSATKGLAELNHHLLDEQKDARDRGACEGQGLFEEDESGINEGGEDANCGRKELAVQQRPQQQPQGPQGPVVHWERFLPIQSLKVLLVEDDDSTRHVVSALLQNCSYEVTAVANSLEAWKILEDLTNHIDLVLMEVVMPYLSGIGLLHKIMSHKTFKNIPVIMMSSNDSMGIVFKCLSKGAVDFLVKPIRKNELKNLWQHVWRKCHSSSGSGSESGVQTKKSTKSKSVEDSDYNMGSNNEDDNVSTDLNVRDGSDNGSGTQSSWTKRVVEFDSPESMSPRDQRAVPSDRTCAQVLHSRPKAFSNNWPPTMATQECHGQGYEHGNVTMGKDLEIGVHRNPDLQLANRGRKLSATVEGTRKDMLNDLESKKDCKKLEKEKPDLNCETQNWELRKEAADLIGTMANFTDPRMESVGIDVPNDISKTNIRGKAIYHSKDIPSLELSLKTLRNVGEIGTRAQERNVLRHSDLSAFSRYNTTSAANQAPTGNVGSCSPFDNSSEAARTESMHNLKSNFNGNPNQHSNGSSNNNDMGSTTNNAFTKPEASGDRPMSKSAINLQSGSAFQPVQNGNLSSHQSGKADATTVNTVLAQSIDKHQQVQIQHHHHHYHHYHHHVHDGQQNQLPNHDDPSLRKHCGPSNSSSMPIEGNAANYSSLNGSTSGGNNGSNGENGCGTAVLPEGANVSNDNGLDGKCGAAAAGGSGSGSGVDQNRYAQREAALNKFRLKRKDRCFEKKVRYQSRKRLAEQRPRVRGQFVRQIACENNDDDDKDC